MRGWLAVWLVMVLAAPAVSAFGQAAPTRATPSQTPAPSGPSSPREPAEDEEAVDSGARPPPAEPAQPAAPTPEAYDARVRDSFAAAEAFQGPLDGGWTLSAQNGGELLAIRIVDKHGDLEAVWRDLRRRGALDGSGVVDEVIRSGDRLTLKFASRPGVEDLVSLRPARGGGWSGELTEGGKTRAVSMTKTSP